MKVRAQGKEFVRPLRSGSKVNPNMKLPGPPEKMAKMSTQVEDLSILKRSVDTSVTNPLEILKVFQGATPEVVDTMKNECSLIYECKVCRNLFRSIANFITHKRSYCTTKFSSTEMPNSNGDILEHSLLVNSMRGTVTSSRKTTRRDILSLLDNFQERSPESSQARVFSEIPHSEAAVYNSTHSTTSAFKEENSTTVVVGPSGHVVGSTQDGGLTTDCKSCGETVRHIETHLSTCNAVFRQCFTCPLCNKFFTTTWAVYRHLKKLHGRNTEQARKLRSLITKSELPVETKLKKQSISIPSTPCPSDKGWLEELEKDGEDGLYKCYICSKQFERRVALLSHMQACEKRKPGSVVETKRQSTASTPVSPKELPPGKPSPAAIQMRVCYKKSASSDKITDCRVVATRLKDVDTLVVLSSAGSKNKDVESKDKDHASPGASYRSNDDVSVVTNNSDPRTNNRELDKNDTDMDDNGSEIFLDDGKADKCETNGEDSRRESEEDTTALYRRNNLSQDLFTTSQGSSDRFEVVPPSTCESETDIPSKHPLINGFLSSPANSEKPDSPDSQKRMCNGWSERGPDPSFYSNFIDSDVLDYNNISERDNDPSIGNSLSNDEDNVDECDFDSLDVTRIICGSVKPILRNSEDETQEEDGDFKDSCSMNSDKPTPSISTDISLDFDAVEPEYSYSDHEDDDVEPVFNSYVSKSDRVCRICHYKIPDNRLASNHVAKHLGTSRFACGIPSCSFQSYSRYNMVEHIRSDHMLQSSSLIKTLKLEEIFTDYIPDFHGFDVLTESLRSSYQDFFNFLSERNHISHPEIE